MVRSTPSVDSVRRHGQGPIRDALTLLLDAGKAAGDIRLDVDARDVVLLIGYLSRLDQAEWDARARPLMRIVLDGVRDPDWTLPAAGGSASPQDGRLCPSSRTCARGSGVIRGPAW